MFVSPARVLREEASVDLFELVVFRHGSVIFSPRLEIVFSTASGRHAANVYVAGSGMVSLSFFLPSSGATVSVAESWKTLLRRRMGRTSASRRITSYCVCWKTRSLIMTSTQ